MELRTEDSPHPSQPTLPRQRRGLVSVGAEPGRGIAFRSVRFPGPRLRLYVNDALLQDDAETFAEYQPYLASGLMSSSRAAVTLATGLHRAGFFASGAKVGIVHSSSPMFVRVKDRYLKPTLASLGVNVVAEAPSSTTAAPQAVLAMNGKADHVIFLSAAGGSPLFFMNHAQSQGYFPRYGLASPDSPAFQAQNAPPTQLRNSMAVGWIPGVDVLNPEAPPLTAAEKRCLDVHKAAGTDYGQTRNEAAWPALAFCDMVWLLEEAGKAAGPNLNRAAWSAALAKLGASHDTTLTWGTSFGPKAFDGAVSYRPLAYDDSTSCRCFRYTGAAQSVPR